VKGLCAKSSTWMPDGSVDYNYASARVMGSTDGMALVRVTGEIDHCTPPKPSAAINEALSEGACSSQGSNRWLLAVEGSTTRVLGPPLPGERLAHTLNTGPGSHTVFGAGQGLEEWR
jgi:hypothetical protein